MTPTSYFIFPRIIGIVDTVGLKLAIEESTESLLYPSLAVSVKPTDGTNFQETIFSITDPTNVLVRLGVFSSKSISLMTESLTTNTELGFCALSQNIELYTLLSIFLSKV